MSWNYRILAYVKNKEVWFKIHSVYYDKDGIPNGYSSNPESVESDSLDGVKWNLKKMKECLKKPILYEGDRFSEEYKPKKRKKKM